MSIEHVLEILGCLEYATTFVIISINTFNKYIKQSRIIIYVTDNIEISLLLERFKKK